MAPRFFDLARFLPLLLPIALISCAPQPQPALPAAPPAPPPPPSPAPAPVRADDWRDWPIAAGSWRYVPGSAVTSARYGEGQVSQFVVQCDVAARRITLMRAGTTSELAIIATTRNARFPAGHIDDRGTAMSGVILSASDAFLDVIAFSRGRFAVMSPGLPALALPAWAEPARVVEDCRK